MPPRLFSLERVGKDREAWCVAINGVAESQTRLIDWTTITTLKIKKKLKKMIAHVQTARCRMVQPRTWSPVDLKDSGSAAAWEPWAVCLLQKLPLATEVHPAQGHILFLGKPVSNDCYLWGYNASNALPQIITTLKGHPSIKVPHGVSWGFCWDHSTVQLLLAVISLSFSREVNPKNTLSNKPPEQQ